MLCKVGAFSDSVAPRRFTQTGLGSCIANKNVFMVNDHMKCLTENFFMSTMLGLDYTEFIDSTKCGGSVTERKKTKTVQGLMLNVTEPNMEGNREQIPSCPIDQNHTFPFFPALLLSYSNFNHATSVKKSYKYPSQEPNERISSVFLLIFSCKIYRQ